VFRAAFYNLVVFRGWGCCCWWYCGLWTYRTETRLTWRWRWLVCPFISYWKLNNIMLDVGCWKRLKKDSSSNENPVFDYNELFFHLFLSTRCSQCAKGKIQTLIKLSTTTTNYTCTDKIHTKHFIIMNINSFLRIYNL